jgi:hypothetical protein
LTKSALTAALAFAAYIVSLSYCVVANLLLVFGREKFVGNTINGFARVSIWVVAALI